MADPLAAVIIYGCCPSCKGVVSVTACTDQAAVQAERARMASGGFRAHGVFLAAGQAAFPVGYRLAAGCAHTHEVPAA